MRIVVKKSRSFRHIKAGCRKDLGGQFFRSAAEANLARYYNHLGIRWDYEPKTFYFEGIRRGTTHYTPDFYLPGEHRWIELKGYLDPISKTKLKRFKKYYPEEFAKLEVMDWNRYRALDRQCRRIIKNWE